MDDTRKLSMHPLTFLPDVEGVSIGRYGTDTFAVFPEDGAELVRKLYEGMTIGEATRWYEETYQEELDMNDFLDTLRELTFLNESDEAQTAPALGAHQPVKFQALGKWMFSPVAWVLYAAIVLTSIAFMWNYPELRPQRNHIFFSDYATLVILGLFIGQMPGILFHESMHLLAGRRLGLPTKMSVGRRMYLLVFQSSMPGIYGLPRRKRYLPFLAGMLGDVVYFSFLVIVGGLMLKTMGHLNLFASYCLALSFTTILRFIWQFYFHLQTDIYYVIVTMLGCVNLQQTSREYLRNAWYRLIRKPHKQIDPAQWVERDLQVARWYGPMFALGYGLFLFIAIFVMLPIAYGFLSNVFRNLFGESTPHFWDSVAFVAVNGLQYGTVLWIFLRERKQRRRQRTKPPITQGG